MIELTQIEIEMIISLSLAIISLLTNRSDASGLQDNLLSRFFTMISLLAICGVSYLAYVESRDIVFVVIAVIAILLLLFFFVVLSLRRK